MHVTGYKLLVTIWYMWDTLHWSVTRKQLQRTQHDLVAYLGTRYSWLVTHT